MPSGMENLDNNRFILRYEHPWGGVASDASQEDIAPNQLVSSDGLFIRHGKLCSTCFYAFDPNYFRYSSDGLKLYMTNTTGMKAIYTVGSDIVGIDFTCSAYVYSFGGNMWLQDQILNTTYQPHYSCSVMIKGVIYVFDYDNGAEYVYTPRVSFVPAVQIDGSNQTFVGGKYCMTVDRYLITCYTNMPTDTPQYKANGYSWSGPSKYTTFNPSIDPAANEGWNILAEVQQEITGCFAMGNVGYILHDQGLTQLTPTGLTGTTSASIFPFDATLMWGGKDGAGCTMPDSLAIYGYIAVWGNNSNIYMFSSGAAPQSITGTARRAIFRDLNKFKYFDSRYFDVHGNIINVGVDNLSPELVYNLYITYESPANTVPITMIVWSCILATQTWTRTVINVTDIMQKITGNPNYAGVSATFGPDATVPSTFRFPSNTSAGANWFISSIYGGMIFNVQDPGSGIGDSFFLFQYINSDGTTSLPSNVFPNTNLVFRAEEFQIYRQPTIRGIILRASGTGTLHINVGSQSFSDIVVNSPNGTTLYRSYGMRTDIAPQISITSTDFNGYISKVHAFGTYAEGEPI